MITDWLTADSDEHLGRKDQEVRLKPDLALGEQPDMLSDHQLHAAPNIDPHAANAIGEIARRNKRIEAEAQEAVEAYKAEAEEAKKWAAEMQGYADALELHMEEMASEFQSRVVDLENKLRACCAELELSTRKCELAREELVHLSTATMNQLGDAGTKLQDLDRETRARLGDLRPATGHLQSSLDHDDLERSEDRPVEPTALYPDRYLQLSLLQNPLSFA